MHVASPSLVGDVKTIKHLRDPRQTDRREPGHRLPDASEPPATARESELLRALVKRLREVGNGHIDLPRSLHRWKKRACALVLLVSVIPLALGPDTGVATHRWHRDHSGVTSRSGPRRPPSCHLRS